MKPPSQWPLDPSIIYACDHEPKVQRHGEVLAVCVVCDRRNREYLRAKTSYLPYRSDSMYRHPSGRRLRLFRFQNLREPTMEDLT